MVGSRLPCSRGPGNPACSIASAPCPARKQLSFPPLLPSSFPCRRDASARVVLGAHSLKKHEDSQQTVGILDSIAHPLYDPQTVKNDIRLLKVSSGKGCWGGGGADSPPAPALSLLARSQPCFPIPVPGQFCLFGEEMLRVTWRVQTFPKLEGTFCLTHRRLFLPPRNRSVAPTPPSLFFPSQQPCKVG